MIHDDQSLTPLINSVLLTPNPQSIDRALNPDQTVQTHQLKPRLYGLGIFPEEPVKLSVPRRWDADTFQQSFRHKEDYKAILHQYVDIEVKRQEAIRLFLETEQNYVNDIQRQLNNVDAQIVRMMATRHAHRRTNALPRVRRILAETLKLHQSFLDKLNGIQQEQSPCVISFAGMIGDDLTAILGGLPYIMNSDKITSIACVGENAVVERTGRIPDNSRATEESRSSSKVRASLLAYPALIKVGLLFWALCVCLMIYLLCHRLS